MKAAVVTGLFAFAVVLATMLHAQKIKGVAEEQDIVAGELQGIERHVGTAQPIYLLPVGVKGEVFLHARFALAPRHVEMIHATDAADTVLIIGDRALRTSLPGRPAVLWEYIGSAYHYQLVSTAE